MMYGMTTNCHVKGGVAREVEIAKKPEKKNFIFQFGTLNSCGIKENFSFNGIALPLPT